MHARQALLWIVFYTQSAIHAAIPLAKLNSLLPPGKTISDYPQAEQQLAGHILQCGKGVVEGVEGKNRCSYTIKLDETFLTPMRDKTGFIYDPYWPYDDGIQWEMPTQQQLNNVPRMWDLSAHGKMIRIVRQECRDCWAQASRANLEQLILSFEGLTIPLSTQTLISSCCNTGTCAGGKMTTPSWVLKHGLPLLDRDPYQGKDTTCQFDLNADKMDYFLMKSPYVGNSLRYSRAIHPSKRFGPKIQEIQALMIKYRSSAVVTIQAIDHFSGVIKECSAINAKGNHMQNIVGWYEFEGDLIARVQNSWGPNHGINGYTHLKWECGTDELNRGLGKSARVGVYAIPCSNPPEARTVKSRSFPLGKAIRIGNSSNRNQKCSWVPKEGLSDPNSCNPIANPKMTTEYHLTATTSCGEASAMTLITPVDSRQKPTSGNRIRTPYGILQKGSIDFWYQKGPEQ